MTSPLFESIFEEHSRKGWDGAEAPALDSATIENVRTFIQVLPPWVPAPEFAMEPDGAVSLEWYAGPSRIFSVSVGHSARLACAGLDGTDSWHGVAQFDGAKVPDFVLQSIRRIFA